MSEAPKKQKPEPRPANQQAEKKNTDAWKQKQALKKQKEAEGQGQVDTAKQQKKKKKEKNKQQQKVETKDKPRQQVVAANKQQPKQQQPLQKKAVEKKYKTLQTIDTLVVPLYPHLLENREFQISLIEKQMVNLIRPRDKILFLGSLDLSSSSQVQPGGGRANYELIQIEGMTQLKNSQLVTRYEDISFLMSEQIDKVFIQALVVFQNGSALVPKGYENIVILANYNNKPVVVSSGSWNYSRILISNYGQLESLYGPEITACYDWVESEAISLVTMEFGSVMPSQVSYHVEQGYRNYGIGAVKW